jgi:nucleotide-binding universal stress UspA family protein
MYKLTEDSFNHLREDAELGKNAAPLSVMEKLEPIKSEEFQTIYDFESRLRDFLTPEELKKYRAQLIDAAEVTESFDRITGEQKPMWDRNPEDETLQPAKIWGTNKDRPKTNEVTVKEENPFGFLRNTELAQKFAGGGPINWLTWFGIIGLMIAFGHSILAMSGEETLAQVYREVQSPKLPNFKKAAFVVFVYSLLFTASISFLAVWLIPDEVRMRDYSDNLIGGLAMYVVGLPWMRLLLNGFVVVVGFLILAGAVNTAIIGSNGVLNRVSEDGVLPDWFLKPHPRFGTTYRLLYLIVGLQIGVLLVSQGNMLLLGEAYAFGVVWSFVFKALAMVVLRFRDPSPREFKVPFNIRIGKVEFPIGLSLIFLVLLSTAILNFLTKEVATISGVIFTVVFLGIFMVSEHYHEKRRRGKHEHLEQFNRQTAEDISPTGLGLRKRYRKLVAIRSPQNLYMLEKALAETDPDTTDVVVMTAKAAPAGDSALNGPDLDTYDQHLMTAVVDRAEKAGKQVKPLIVPTNNPLFAVIKTAKELAVQELVMGASNKYTADEQLEQIGFYWISTQDGETKPITIRILGQGRDVYLDLNGGNRIPKISERKARSVAELRSAGVGVDRVLLVHQITPAGKDLFQAVLTMLDPQVPLTLVPVFPNGQASPNGPEMLYQEQEQANQLDREIQIESVQGDLGPEVVRLAREGQFDLVILPLPPELPAAPSLPLDDWINYILRHAHCPVFLAAAPAVPQEVAD